MRLVIGFAALAVTAGVVSAQQSDAIPARSSPRRPSADRGMLPIPPDCVWLGPATPSALASDSVCLTRAEVIALALVRNPQLRAGFEQVAQARARKVEGTAIPDPQLSYIVDGSNGLFGSGGSVDKTLSTTLQIPFPDKFRLRGRIGRADVRATEATLESLRQAVAAQASQEYDSLLAALRHRNDLTVAKTLAVDFLQKTEARFQAGSAPRLDVIRARVDVAKSGNDLISNERDIVNARAALNRVLARPLGLPIAVADTLVLPPPLPALEVVEAAAYAARPDLMGIARQIEGARATTALAKEYWLPDVIFGVGKNYSSPGPGVLTTGLAMPLPVFFWQHSKGEIAESRHRERELEATYSDLRAQVGQDVRASYATAATALLQAAYLRDELLPAAREAYRIASLSYGLGGSSALDVLDARRGLLDAEGQYTDALAAANIARADLQRAAATTLESIATGGSRDH